MVPPTWGHVAIDIHNAEAALSKVEVSLSTLPYSEAAKLAAEDTYDLGDDVCVRFDLLGIPIEVHDPALGRRCPRCPPSAGMWCFCFTSRRSASS